MVPLGSPGGGKTHYYMVIFTCDTIMRSAACAMFCGAHASACLLSGMAIPKTLN